MGINVIALVRPGRRSLFALMAPDLISSSIVVRDRLVTGHRVRGRGRRMNATLLPGECAWLLWFCVMCPPKTVEGSGCRCSVFIRAQIYQTPAMANSRQTVF